MNTLLEPTKRTAAGTWLNWTQKKLPSAASSDANTAVYSGGIVPTPAWGIQGGAASLLAAISTDDASYAARSAPVGSTTTSPYLRVLFSPAETLPDGAALQAVSFFVRRAGCSRSTTTDSVVYLIKGGVYQTSINKAGASPWWADQTALELVEYTFTAAELSSLGVTVADLATGFGIGLRITQTGMGLITPEVVDGEYPDETTAAIVDLIECQIAYTIVNEAQAAVSELPHASGASSWLKLAPISGTVPEGHEVLGIEFDLLGFCDDGNAAAASPIQADGYAGPGTDPAATTTVDVDAGTNGWTNAGSLAPGQLFDLSSTPTTWRTWLSTRDFSNNNTSGSGYNFPFDQSGAWNYGTAQTWAAAPVQTVEPTMPRFAWSDFTDNVVSTDRPAPNARPFAVVGVWKATGVTPGLNESSAFYVGHSAQNLLPPDQSQTWVLWLRFNIPPQAYSTGGGGGPIVEEPEGEPGGPVTETLNPTLPTTGSQVAAFTLLKFVPQHSILEVALSLDGSNPIGSTWYVFLTTNAVLQTAGSSSNLWGRSWVPDDFGGSFALLIRRPAASKAVSSQYATLARARVTHNPLGGSIMGNQRQKLSEIVLLGLEGTAGTLASSFRRLRALNYKSRPNMNLLKHVPQGEKMNAVSLPVQEWSTGSISGILDYNEIGFVFESVIGTGLHSGGTINQRNIHTYALENRKRSSYKTCSLQRGTDVRAHQNTHLVHDGISVQITPAACQVSGSFFGKALTDGATLATAPNAVQTVQVTGTPTGGTFKLSYRGQETAAIAYNALAAAMVSALEAVPGIGSGNVAVSLASSTYTITFQGALAGTVQPMLRLANNGLTGGTSPSVTIAQTTAGDYDTMPLVPVVPGHWSIYVADSQAGLAAGKLAAATSGVAAAGFDFGGRHNPYFTLDRAGVQAAGNALEFTDTTEVDPKFVANLLVAANSTGMALLSTLRSGATKWVRMEAIGPVIGGTADTHKFIVEGCVKIADASDFDETDGRVLYPYPLEFCEGPNGEVPTITLENGIATY